MNENNSLLQDIAETPEEVLWPPKIDAMWILLMSLVSLIVGGIISVGVLIASFFSLGKFSIESGVSPVFLALTTFFAVTIGLSVYVYIAKTIFPAIYTRTRHSFKHVMIYSMVLYICMMPVYIMAPTWVDTIGVLIAYLIHIMLAVFGLELIVWVIAQYRYVLLSFYANIAAMIVSGWIVFSLFRTTTASGASLFILMGLSILAFFLSTLTIFVIKFLYYKFYTITGNDPLGSLFYNIEQEEKTKVENAQNTLLQ